LAIFSIFISPLYNKEALSKQPTLTIMKKLIYTLLVCIAFLYASELHSQTYNKIELEKKIDALIPSQVNEDTPGLVVGIVQNGALIFKKGYGLANLSYNIPNSPKMLYNIGSVSKQFLGYAFAMLHVKGELNIDDPVGKYLKDWPTFKHQVTLRHLLTHTSGYREAYTMSSLAGRIIGVDRLTRKECLDVVRKQPQLEFTPGSRYTYNSTAWVILAEILKNVTGTPADVWVTKNILRPLAMNDTHIESFIGEVVQNAAESYSKTRGKGHKNEKSNRAIFGAADIYTNIEDLVKWIDNYKTAQIGGKKVSDVFLNPYTLNNGSNAEYALGIGIGSYKGLKRYRHTGGHEAFQTQLSYFPDHDLGIITISNYGGRGWLPTSRIADLLLSKHMTIETPNNAPALTKNRNALEKLTGLYVANTFNGSITIAISNGSLEINGRRKLIPVSKNTYAIEGQQVKIKFAKNSKNSTQLTLLGTNKDHFTKSDSWTPNEKTLNEFKGDYWSKELETVYHLSLKKNKLVFTHRWNTPMTLTPVSKDFFKTNRGYHVKFTRNRAGDITGYNIHSGRTLNVFFQRK